MINNICNYTPRTDLIIEKLLPLYEEGRCILVLSDRRNHLLDIENGLKKHDIESGYYVGGMKPQGLRDAQEKNVILGTFSMASEGMDIPKLNTMILASPKSDIVQSVGRILRQKKEIRKFTPLIIDIDQISVFGAPGNPSSKVKARRLKLKDPRIRKKYLATLKKLYKIHKIVEKVVELNGAPVEYPITTDTARKYEEIDRIRVECMKHSEKKCRKFKTGKIPWSPEVTMKLRIIELWTLVAKRLRGCKVNSRTIIRKKI